MSGTKRKPSAARIIGLSAVVFVAIALAVVILIPNFIDTRQRETPPASKCINNLRLIDGAKAMWALDHNKTDTNVPTWADLKPYLCGTNNYPLPKCPSGGAYTLGSVTNLPSCSIPGHVLPGLTQQN
jgi:hypothetical protein